MKLAPRLLPLLVMVTVCAGIASAQVATGTSPFGSFGGGPFDAVNVGNLNVHLSIPILNKAGRGLPFSYDLSYDSSIWYPVTRGSTTSWEPTANWGWTSQSLAVLGYLKTVTTTQDQFLKACDGTKSTNTSTYTYIDSRGVPHPFSGSTWYAYTSGGFCGTGYSYGPTLNAQTADGSGYTLTAPANLTGDSVTTRSGVLVYTNVGSSGGNGGYQDANGNELTVSNSAGQFFDTLSATTPVLTQAGSGTPSSPLTYTYAAPSGGNGVVSVNYTQYTVATAFGLSGISEYGPLSEALVSTITLPDNTTYVFTYEKTPGSCTPLQNTWQTNCVTGRIASVTLPTGGTITYTYSGGPDGTGIFSDGSTAGLNRILSASTTCSSSTSCWQYSRSLVSGSPGPGSTWTTTAIDPSNNDTVLNFVEDGDTGQLATYDLYETERQVYQGSTGGTLLKTTYTCYNGAGVPCNSTSLTLPITEKEVAWVWPGSLEAATLTWFNSNGLVTQKNEYSYGSGDNGPLVRETLISYANLSNGIVNAPAAVTVEDGSGNVKSQTTYTYDQGSVTATSGTPQHISVTGSRGNATTIAYLVSGSTTLSKAFTYYDTGNVSVATDVNNAQTTYTYGTGSCGNSFVTSVSEPLSLSKSMTWNCTGGVETSITDENGKEVSINYADPDFWRPNSTIDQLSNTTDLTYTAQTSVESSLVFSSSTTDVLATLDGFGRKHISQTKEAPGSSTYDSVETDYDSLGRPNRTTLPYSGTAGQTNSSAPATNTVYDALSRKTQVTDSGGRDTAYSYNQNDTYLSAGPAPTGENAKRRQFEYDALHRLTSVCEVTSGTGSGTCAQTSTATGYWTQYRYDLNNNLTGVTQNAQSANTQTRTYAYDDLGRMTSETNPESGTTTYTYDSDSTCGTSEGDLVKKVDAVGNTICYAYDVVHRITSTTYPSGSYASVTPSRYFAYDSATVDSVAMVNAKTRMAEAYTCFSPCSSKLTDIGFSYTARGQVSDVYEKTPNSGGYYHVNQTYWANGVLNQLSGLSALPTITYGVDGEGRVYSATASSGQNPLSSTTYNVASLPTQVGLGSADSDSFSYDPNTDRMTEYEFTVNSQSVSGTLTWNAVGTLASLAITDPFNSSDAQTCSYSHDDLVRIASVNCGSIWSQTFSYDAFGNIDKSGSMSFGASYSYLTNRMTQIGSSYPTYDSNGNVTNDFLNTYAWDANGRPVTADTVGITYDALGRMVEQDRGGAYTQIVYAPSGAKLALMTGSTLQKGFVPLTGGSMAIYNSSGLAYYRHSDWVGSSRFASTPSRTLYFDGAYAPFGEAYASTGTTDLSFTGMNQDTAANLYDFQAREYGIQGRWPSPDPSGISSVHPKDPQTWNRYAYVRNNPLSLTDPTGLQFMCGCFSWLSFGAAEGWGGGGDSLDLNDPFAGGGTGYGAPDPYPVDTQGNTDTGNTDTGDPDTGNPDTSDTQGPPNIPDDTTPPDICSIADCVGSAPNTYSPDSVPNSLIVLGATAVGPSAFTTVQLNPNLDWYGAGASVTYQVVDQYGAVMAVAGMIPYEVDSFGYSGQVGPVTDSNGQYTDSPIGGVNTFAFSSSTFTQGQSVTYQGTSYPMGSAPVTWTTTQTFGRSYTVQGSNGVDVTYNPEP